MNRLIKYFLPEIAISIIIWAIVGWKLGLSALILVLILSVLEMTLSADNAVVNSRVLMRMSHFWQKMFLTVGIVMAVFVVRFLFPILLVALATSLSMGEVYELALNDPTKYGEHLKQASPMVDSFGGMFLLMVALYYFIDKNRPKQTIWLHSLESGFLRIDKVPVARLLSVAGVYALIVGFAPEEVRGTVALSAGIGIMTFLGMHGLTQLIEKFSDQKDTVQRTGFAAFSLFMYLQVLDASFSLDGVVGAFALTNNIFIIMAGLGVGALWVRAMTLHMVERNTLSKYRYIESGAHWAILALAIVMILKLFHIELPELIVGTIGLAFVGGAVYASRRASVYRP